MAQFNKTKKQNAFQEIFLENLNDPRRTKKGNLLHNFGDILFLVLSSALCGIADWEGIEIFGTSQITWLKKFRKFENGIPSHDTINRVVSSLNSEQFNQCFIEWINTLSKLTKGEVIAIDGKCIKGSSCKTQNINAVHIVSAYAVDNELCIGQCATDVKSNEITAIPALLNLIAIKGCTVTIDAMGCQTEIASQIRKANANYILAVKGNQSGLEQGIKDAILFSKPVDTDIEDDFGHGRIEKRSCFVYDNLSHIENLEKWEDLKTIIKIKTEVIEKATNKRYSEERLYISSLESNAKYINRSIRKHWAVENKLHWNLDVVFNEDSSKKRTKNAAENFNIINKIALTIVQKDNSNKKNKKQKMLMAALDVNYREKLLNL